MEFPGRPGWLTVYEIHQQHACATNTSRLSSQPLRLSNHFGHAALIRSRPDRIVDSICVALKLSVHRAGDVRGEQTARRVVSRLASGAKIQHLEKALQLSFNAALGGSFNWSWREKRTPRSCPALPAIPLFLPPTNLPTSPSSTSHLQSSTSALWISPFRFESLRVAGVLDFCYWGSPAAASALALRI